MRVCALWMTCLVCGLLAGCAEEATEGKASKNLDAELVNTVNNIQVENAIITQHTLYPYHFVTDGAKLNDLGQRDLGVLAQHYKEHPGLLNIRRGEASDALYEARVASVMAGLKEAGVEMSRMSASDTMPGGTGMPSERVVTILQKESETRSRSTSTTTTGTRGSSSRGMITQ
jgi:hypothetical protein